MYYPPRRLPPPDYPTKEIVPNIWSANLYYSELRTTTAPPADQ